MNKNIKLAVVAASAASFMIAGSAFAGSVNNVPANQTPIPGQSAQPQRPQRGGPNNHAQGDPRSQAGKRGQGAAEGQKGARPQQGVFHGKVSSVDGSTLVFELPVRPQRPQAAGSTPAPTAPAATNVKVATDASTKFIVTGVNAASIANIKAGDRVSVLLQKPVDRNALKAASVFVAPLPTEAHAGGTVENISATGFSLKTARGSDKVSVGASTKVIILGKLDGSLADIANGDKVQVAGKPSSSTAIDAAQIVKQNKDAAHFAGQIVSITGNSVVIWTGQGEQLTVDVSKAVFVGKNTAADLKIGQRLAGAGVKNADGGITAQLIGGGNAGRGVGAGHPGQRGPGGPKPKQAKGTGV